MKFKKSPRDELSVISVSVNPLFRLLLFGNINDSLSNPGFRIRMIWWEKFKKNLEPT